MKRTLIGAAVAAAAIVSAVALAEMAGPGGIGYGMGAGMMMPGMMGGPGMMHGPGTMGGFGGGAYASLDLNAEQRTKLAEIQRELSGRQSDVMTKMHAQGFHMHDLPAGSVDEDAARKALRSMSDAHDQMFEATLEARRRMDAVLTPEQREQLRRNRETTR